MTVAIFSDSYLPVINGVSIAIDLLVVELRKMGHRVYVFTPSFPGHVDEGPYVIRFASFMTPWTKGYPLAIPPFGRTLKRFRKLKVDLIHTHTPYTVGFCGLRWAESHGLPIVSTYHTLYENYGHYIPYLPRGYVGHKIAKHTNYYYNRVNYVITPSEAAKDSLLRHDVRTPTEIIPTGIPTAGQLDKFASRRELGIPEGQFALLYAGRLAREKNLELLVGSMRRWRETVSDSHLHFVGAGSGQERLELLVKRFGLQDRVTFHPPVPRKMLDTYFAASDVFTFPSRTETQGLVIGEAQAMSLPAVAVEGGGAHEAITDGIDGFIVHDTIEAFAGKVEWLASRPDKLRELGQAAYNASLRRSPASTASRVVEIYERVLHFRREAGDKIAVHTRTD